MDDNYGLTQPGPDASPGVWTAYRQAYSERAMQEHQQHLQKLNAELREKVRYSECERALAPFNQVLVAAGVDAWDAAHAQFKLGSWDDAGFPDDEGLTEDEGRAAVAWRKAIEAGRVELCDRASFVSEEAFGLVDFLEKAVAARRVFFLQATGTPLYPQFYADQRYNRKQLEAVAKRLGDLTGGSKWTFFTSPKGSLGRVTPLVALLDGKLALVKKCADGFLQR